MTAGSRASGVESRYEAIEPLLLTPPPTPNIRLPTPD